jgi:hypothetical protein
MEDKKKEERALREHVLDLLDGRSAHVDVESVFGRIPFDAVGKRSPGNHSIWEIVEHMRIAQWDILEFSRDAKHRSPKFPEDYWPTSPSPASESEWQECTATFRRDLESMKDLIRDDANPFFEPFAHGDGQTLLREALVLADHNAYHLGQVVQRLRDLHAW